MKSRPKRQPVKRQKSRRRMTEVVPVRMYEDEAARLQVVADDAANGNVSELIRHLVRARIAGVQLPGVAA